MNRAIPAILKLLRPHHWLKNLFLFSAPFFGGILFKGDVLLLALPVFLSFSLSASSVYIFNDIIDRERDRLHPDKSKRPIAFGLITPGKAYLLILLILLPSLYIASLIGPGYLILVVSYLVINVLYSIRLKDIAIIDIFCIAAGFVIRVMAGGAAFRVDVSPWLFSTMLMISLVLASGKRLSESEKLRENASQHRESLGHYSRELLKSILIISSSSALICYALYTIEQARELIYTLPVVTLGLFRYLMVSEKGLGDATEAMIRDKTLTLIIVIWLFMIWVLRNFW